MSTPSPTTATVSSSATLSSSAELVASQTVGTPQPYPTCGLTKTVNGTTTHHIPDIGAQASWVLTVFKIVIWSILLMIFGIISVLNVRNPASRKTAGSIVVYVLAAMAHH